MSSLEEAEALARESLSIREGFGQRSAAAGQSQLCLGQVLARAAKLDEAEQALRQALEIA